MARKLYGKCMKSNHQHVRVMSSNLFISKDNPLLRAGLDAIVSCHCRGKAILEINVHMGSDNLQSMTGEEITQEGKYHLKTFVILMYVHMYIYHQK